MKLQKDAKKSEHNARKSVIKYFISHKKKASRVKNECNHIKINRDFKKNAQKDFQ